MSYATTTMKHQLPTTAAITIAAPTLAAHQDFLPHMLRQQNFTSQPSFTPASVNVTVSPHVSQHHETGMLRGTTQVAHAQLYPNTAQSQPAPQHTHAQEDDWNKHAIVTSVAGLQTKLVQLDSEIRTAPAADAGHVMRHIQDHASILRQNSEHMQSVTSRQKEITGVTHEICSHLNDQLGSHATALQRYQNNISNLQHKQKNAVELTHNICSQLNETLESHASATSDLEVHSHRQSAQIAQMQKKDEIAHALLTKILTMLGEHSDVVSQLHNHLSPDHHVLLDAMCEALEKTKGKMTSFEKTQTEMQRVLADFQHGRLASHAPGRDTEDIKARLDTYAKMSKQMDLQFSQALQNQQSKIRDLEHKVHGMSANNQQVKINELEDRLHELSLHQLNNSQNAAVIRTTDRDVKMLQHDVRQVHALKDDVQLLKQRHETDMEQLRQSSLSGNAVRTDVADMHTKLHELRRDFMLQDVRLDKTHMHITEMRKKMDM
jgi:hypothetical protein